MDDGDRHIVVELAMVGEICRRLLVVPHRRENVVLVAELAEVGTVWGAVRRSGFSHKASSLCRGRTTPSRSVTNGRNARSMPPVLAKTCDRDCSPRPGTHTFRA